MTVTTVTHHLPRVLQASLRRADWLRGPEQAEGLRGTLVAIPRADIPLQLARPHVRVR